MGPAMSLDNCLSEPQNVTNKAGHSPAADGTFSSMQPLFSFIFATNNSFLITLLAPSGHCGLSAATFPLPPFFNSTSTPPQPPALGAPGVEFWLVLG